jgi:cell filamentation protein
MTDYFVSGDNILDNKLGISDPQEFKIAEQDIVTKKSVVILNETSTIFNFEFLLHIHKILFEDLYDFAGKIRNVDITNPEEHIPFAYARFIESEAKRIFFELKSKEYLFGLDKNKFIKEITNLSAELNALHPFRDGNGRTIRLFLILLADHTGYLLDYSQVSAEEIINADKLAFEGNTNPLLFVYKKVVTKI